MPNNSSGNSNTPSNVSAADASATAIELRNVSYNLPNGRSLLHDLSLTVENGETLVLLGRSGAGKSTALKLINRMLELSGGEIRVEGKSTIDWDPIALRRHIGYVIQEIGLFPHYTVEQNISLVPRLEKWPEDRTRARVAELMKLVGLEPAKFLHRHPHELSGGQRQRVGIARALAADPPILLLDEPFGALDPLTRGEMQDMLRGLLAGLKKTVLLVTHDLDEALYLADRIVLLHEGRLIANLKTAEFLDSRQPEIQEYVRAFHRGSRATGSPPGKPERAS